jgi:protein-tyrosine phosphatase
LPPLVDMHVHLLAGLDDGPRTLKDAIEMARLMVADGVRHSVSLAHQNEEYPAVTPARIRTAWAELAQALNAAEVPLEVFPCSEVMSNPEVVAAWKRGDLMSVADRSQWILLEFPHNYCFQFAEVRSLVRDLREAGLRTILAHAERTREMLYEPGIIEELIHMGCTVQVSSSSITNPAAGQDEKALRSWFKRGIVHLLGSDGHSLGRRKPYLADAAQRIQRWVGAALAEQICSSNGLAILRGAAPAIAPPQPPSRSWFSRLFK